MLNNPAFLQTALHFSHVCYGAEQMCICVFPYHLLLLATGRETTERLLKSKTQMHNMLVAAVNTASKQKSAQEQQQQQFQSALRAAKREANKHPETRQQPKLDAPEAVHKTPASKPRTHKFLGQAISISIVHKGVSGSVSPRGICVSETDYAEYIRTAHRWVID